MSTKSNTKSSTKPFCKVCYDAGKPESEYTSHYVRSLPDRNGSTMVTCPTLMTTECHYCGNYGHTIKFCPIASSRNKNQPQKQNYIQHYKEREMPKKTTTTNNPNNVSKFAVLDDSDSEDEEYPTLGGIVAAKAVITGWNEMAAKPPVLVYKQEDPAKNHLVLTPGAKFGKVMPLSDKPKAKLSWVEQADMSDSDDDE
jgi:hypothetical protein